MQINKNVECFVNLRVILHRGQANLPCIIPILVYVLPKQAHPLFSFIFPFLSSRAERHESNFQAVISVSSISYSHDTLFILILFLPFFLFSLIFICFFSAVSSGTSLWNLYPLAATGVQFPEE